LNTKYENINNPIRTQSKVKIKNMNERKSDTEDIVEYLFTILFEQVPDVPQSFFELRKPHCNAVH
jgi:hypothetical protein